VLYDQLFIEELKDRADIVRIIEPYAPLKKKGANWMACCPFHQEKTPSFSVNQAKGFYKCFGCGKGGNVFTFLMEYAGMTFPEAIENVAQITGVPLPEPVDDQKYQQSRKKREEERSLAQKIVELNSAALDLWEKTLASDDPKAVAARKYLDERGISEDIRKQFRLGFSSDSWDTLLSHLREMKFDEAVIEQSGLVSVNEEKDRVYDRFRGRIMFPVLDIKGQPVAFGARAMGDDQPKYLNSPETPAYVKGRHLYGLFQNQQAIRQKQFAILVEGYLDLIALNQFGVTNAVASLGTAFTAEQSRLLHRYTKQVVINYDGDQAGIKAARRAVEILLADDFGIKVLILENGKDPDDFIRENGKTAYNEARRHARLFFDFVLDTSLTGRNIANAKHKADALDEVLPVLESVKSDVPKRQYFDQAMDFFQIKDSGLIRDLWLTVKRSAVVGSESVKRQVKRAAQVKATVAEQQLLEMLVYDRELRDRVFPLLEDTDHEMLASSQIFRALMDLDAENREITAESLLEKTIDDDFSADFVPVLMMAEPRREDGEALDDVLHDAENCLITLRRMAIGNRIQDIARQAILAEAAGDAESLARLTMEQLELKKMEHDLLTKLSGS
jgi:DNA primase